MFVVSRKIEESVIVDGFNSPQRALRVTVLEVKGKRVKLSFEVNADVPALPSHGPNRISVGTACNPVTVVSEELDV